MNSPWQTADGTPQRHALVWLTGLAWGRLMRARDDLAAEPLVPRWSHQGWPLVVRRPAAGEPAGIALGLPLPPEAGKRRLSLRVQREDVLATAPPLALSQALDVAPAPWRPTLGALVRLGPRHGMRTRVFGSLAWQALTGLEYLGAGSDLDLLLTSGPGADPGRLAAAVAAIAHDAPMRIDGEIVRRDGAAVNWRECRPGAPNLLVKTSGGVQLLPMAAFLSGATTP